MLTKLYPTRSHTGAAQGGMCAALANVEEDNWEWHTFDTVKGGDYLVDQDAAEIMAEGGHRRGPRPGEDGPAVQPHARGQDRPAPLRRPHPQPRRGRRSAASCYAADRTGHMILQTLYQNCVKQGVEFFNEFYVLDLLHAPGPTASERTAGVVAYELATGEIHVFQAKAVVLRHRRHRQGLQDHLQRAHPDR